MSEEDLIWLLKSVGKSADHFETLYGVSFKIPDIICFKNGEPKFWFYMEKGGKIKTRDDELLKFRVMKDFFCNPRLTNAELYESLKEMNDFYQYSQNTIESEPKTNKDELIYVSMRGREENKEAQVLKIVRRDIIDDLFKTPGEIQDFLGQWVKCFTCFPPKISSHLSLFEMKYKRNPKEEKGRFHCFRKNLEINNYIEKFDFIKTENMKNLQRTKISLPEENFYKVLASQTLEKGECFMKALIRFLESKYEKKVGSFVIEYFQDINSQIWLIGCSKIQFMSANGDVEIMDKTNFFHNPKKKQNFDEKCAGLYCDLRLELNRIYDENEEEFNLYLLQEKKEAKSLRKSLKKKQVFFPDISKKFQQKPRILYKSILLDFIERKKALERVQEACPSLSKAKIQQISEFLLFKCRKFYALSDLATDPGFRHQKVSNLYSQVPICNFCQIFYKKVDIFRNKILEGLHLSNKAHLSPEEISKEVTKYFSSNPSNPGILSTESKERRLFSSDFIEKLSNFDKITSDLQKGPSIAKTSDGFPVEGTIDLLERPSHFQLPVVFHEEICDKEKVFQKERIYIKAKESEKLGLKHFLGHTKNLPYADCGLAISKSSYNLNKLQDKIGEIEKIQQKQQDKKFQEMADEIKMINCPYYGKGNYDTEPLHEIIKYFKEQEKHQESIENQSHSLMSPSIQVVTDKNDFLTENQKRLKMDKEKKMRDTFLKKKNFMETYSDLSSSIMKRPPPSPNRNSYFLSPKNRGISQESLMSRDQNL